MKVIAREVVLFRTKEGRIPLVEWLQTVRDRRLQQRIQARIDRLSLGNFGHTRSVGEGVHELKIDFGPGFRIYFGCHGEKIVVLLYGGDKGSQDEDIKEAKKFWKAYKRKAYSEHSPL